MKKVILMSLVFALMVGLGTAFANPEGVCPDGKLIGHLKIIGVKNDKNPNMDKAAGNVIFVDLGEDGEFARTEILLTPGDDFAVLDKNGTDGEAEFMMPPTGLDPYIVGDKQPNESSVSNYSVYIRALGTPGGKASIVTCGTIKDDFAAWLSNKVANILSIDRKTGDKVCSLEQVTNEILVRDTTKGKPKFINVTAELLTIVFEVTVQYVGGGSEIFTVRVPVFSDLMENYLWQYDNEGLKNLDIRFYDCSSDVTDWD